MSVKNLAFIVIVVCFGSLGIAIDKYLLPDEGIDLYRNPISSFCGKPLNELQMKSPLTSFSGGLVEVLAARDLSDDAILRIVSCDSKETKLLKTYEENENFTIIRAGEGHFLGGRAKSTSSIIYLLFVFLENRSGMHEWDAKLHLEVFVFDGIKEVWSSPDLVISEMDANLMKTNSEWAVANLETNGPAITPDARILLSDADHDGYFDIVIWKKTIESKEKTEVADSDRKPFRFKEQSLSVMLFDPKENSFSMPQSSHDLEAPEESLWKKASALSIVNVEDYYE